MGPRGAGRVAGGDLLTDREATTGAARLTSTVTDISLFTLQGFNINYGGNNEVYWITLLKFVF